MEIIKLSVSGMSCNHCVRAIENALKNVDGISETRVSLSENTVELKFDSTFVSKEKIASVIEEEGYKVSG